LIGRYQCSECGILSGDYRVARRGVYHHTSLRVSFVIAYKQGGKRLSDHGIRLPEIIDVRQTLIQLLYLVVDVGKGHARVPTEGLLADYISVDHQLNNAVRQPSRIHPGRAISGCQGSSRIEDLSS